MARKPRKETPEVLAKKKEMMKVVGKNLKRLRLQKEITQEEMADILGIKASTVSRIERGEIMLSLSHIARLCVKYGLDFVYFFRRDYSHLEADQRTGVLLGNISPELQKQFEQGLKNGDELLLQKLLQEMEKVLRFFLLQAKIDARSQEIKFLKEENGGVE